MTAATKGLGRRQRDVLLAAEAGTASIWHVQRGAMAVSGVDGVYGDDVLDRLLDRGLVDRVEDGSVNGASLVLTDAGREALYLLRDRCWTCGAPCVGCTPENETDVSHTCSAAWCGDEWVTDDRGLPT